MISIALLAATATGLVFTLSDDEWKGRCPALITNQEVKSRELKLWPTHQVFPRYPDAQLQRRRDGDVWLLARIDADGLVADLKLIEASHAAFIPNAAAAVRKWRYPKPNFDNRPTCIELDVHVMFRMR